MRTLFTAIILVLVVNVLGIAALTGWLGATGRLSQDRVRAAVATFNHTIEEEQQLIAEAEQADRDAQALAERALRMEQVAGGPVTPEARLASIQTVDEKQRALIERQKVEAEALKRQLDAQQRLIEERIAELDRKQQAFDEAIAEQIEAMESEDFKEAIAMLEGIPPKQAKAVMQEWLEGGDQEQVVAYLSAMEERKAAKVLKEFKLPNEVAQAAVLIEEVRQQTDQLKQEADL
jgi:Tfp pilus assembly protein PilE